jgi:hypothetical protein
MNYRIIFSSYLRKMFILLDLRKSIPARPLQNIDSKDIVRKILRNKDLGKALGSVDSVNWPEGRRFGDLAHPSVFTLSVSGVKVVRHKNLNSSVEIGEEESRIERPQCSAICRLLLRG